jgi:glycosyltransferase involved in cell wall biosynthesis
MHIVIYASGIPFNGGTIEERSLGGSESAAYYVAKEFAARGHRVCVFTEEQENGEWDGVKYLWVGPKDQQNPLGANWHFYCCNTPHDVNLVQRMPGAFGFHIQSKINLWWAHDIALKRNNNHMMAQTWQTTRILPVSNWFKQQIADNWLVDPNIINPIHNGVDYTLFEEFELKRNHLQAVADEGITLLYSSRPERGLENLVQPGGIMEQLAERAPHIKLKVCGYKHPDADERLGGFYNMLHERVDTLPNCEHLGSLTKRDLYQLMCEEADVWCYPTEFEEVSCITAMECMAAGLSIFTTPTAALTETLGDYENCVMIPNTDDGVNIKRFVNRLLEFDNKFRRRPRRNYTWTRVADEIEDIVDDCFEQASKDVDAVARHYLRNSDIVAFKELKEPVSQDLVGEVSDLYWGWMYDQEKYADHYAEGTEEMYDGPDFNYEPAEFVSHPRFQEVARYIQENLSDDSTVIDYGCAHGHFTNYLAREFPAIHFTGIDVSPKAIDVAVEKANELELNNVGFRLDDWLGKPSKIGYNKPDMVILGEILEHVPDPVAFMEVVKKKCPDAHVLITTPFGPWESLSYESDYPKRFHLHHLERADLEDMFHHYDPVETTCLPAGHTPIGEVLGWYITTFRFTEDAPAARTIDYTRKLKQTVPRQTVSFCAIVKNGQYDLPRLLQSVEPVIDEVIIGVDENTTDKTKDVIEDFRQACIDKHRSPQLSVEVFDIPSPVEIGFDAARNLTIDKASKHWIMWADSDEEFVGADRLPKYLKNNGWQGYGVAQHHFSVEPTQVLSTDFPVRIFRRNPKVKFEGVVHEHPANMDNPNDGVGFAWVNQELHFSHLGYGTEEIRRRRFHRNVSLMARDREQNPDRILGRFLWIRDLALMNRFELEQTQGAITPEMQERAIGGLKLWEETLDEYGEHPQVKRMVKDHLEFYDVLVNCMDRGFTFRIKFASGPDLSAPQLHEVPELSARFLNKRHLDKFLSVLINDEVLSYEEKYL